MQRRDTSLAICGKWLTTGRNGGDYTIYVCDIFHMISVATAHYRGAKSIGAAQVENYLRFFIYISDFVGNFEDLLIGWWYVLMVR